MKLPGRENKTAVVVGTVTDDVRVLEVPKLKVSGLGRPWFCCTGTLGLPLLGEQASHLLGGSQDQMGSSQFTWGALL
jgi:hypothetical protein